MKGRDIEVFIMKYGEQLRRIFLWSCALLCSFVELTLTASDDVSDLKKLYIRPAVVPHPPQNLSTPERIALGKMLFFDPRLSASGWISCATCHNPALDWGDGLSKGLGHGMKPLKRKTPTLLNAAWVEPLFWDGRAATLEEQALAPIRSPEEMNMPVSGMLEKLRVNAGYKVHFERAYGKEGISESTVAKALSVFQRTLVSAKAPFDLWVEGNDNAISREAKRGFLLFNKKAACASCHSGWRFADESFHDIGIADDDLGRGGLPDFSNVPAMRHAFKTPTLRNIAGRHPYMHNGSEKTLEAVILFYDRGGNVKRESLSSEIKALGLSSSERADLLEFLKSLTSIDKGIEVPILPH